MLSQRRKPRKRSLGGWVSSGRYSAKSYIIHWTLLDPNPRRPTVVVLLLCSRIALYQSFIAVTVCPVTDVYDIYANNRAEMWNNALASRTGLNVILITGHYTTTYSICFVFSYESN